MLQSVEANQTKKKGGRSRRETLYTRRKEYHLIGKKEKKKDIYLFFLGPSYVVQIFDCAFAYSIGRRGTTMKQFEWGAQQRQIKS
jgi:hypothetical protein